MRFTDPDLRGCLSDVSFKALDTLLDAYGGLPIEAPVDLIKVLEAQGLVLFNAPMENEAATVAGIYIRTENKILVSNKDPLTRRIFTTAHELGHHVIHQDKKTDVYFRNAYKTFGRGYEVREELEADWFAACILTPPSLLLDKWASYGGHLERKLEDLAQFFYVSIPVVLERLLYLGEEINGQTWSRRTT